MKKQHGFTLFEIMITIGISMIVLTSVTVAMFQFRDNIQYDIVFNRIVESIRFAKQKAAAGRFDSGGNRISYSVIFFENRLVEFEGDTYIEGADMNIEYTIPIGFELGSECTPLNNGTITFSPILAENSNNCTIRIYRSESGTEIGLIEVGKYGIKVAN